MITTEQMNAIDGFAEGLRECFRHRLGHIKEELAQDTLQYVIAVINMHQELKQREYEDEMMEWEKKYLTREE